MLCNGSNGTPDLRNSFVLGAGNTYAVGATGGSTDAIVVSHTHTASSVVTDPSHTHTVTNSVFQSIGGGSGGAGGGTLTAASLSINSATTGITVATTNASAGVSGSGANMPPYYALAYIMKS